ncbi:hypothetical protein COCSUDRAFT_59218 [Coccomyxa subellipsoidea C-169]|uniref:RING-type domain-containing protein n=1 Tax=Coccomyxa subellipsoidea (strain C-169) TaxID=574566 RepID=I0Z7T0_COCSC|nr:hypothetical protein COCSUDRAFT_59218 [Coccomyxa subellipsoidea C-169]EIE26699.1 hypothetical protein COCSUDRAFT_59218 [Coccomyxa subellipsoidea C-169]|eukprot:XP_005651243.1 hypothetical protein COCSUDRAFT_59218 [Coccomyxa subellipsoidea C-169]
MEEVLSTPLEQHQQHQQQQPSERRRFLHRSATIRSRSAEIPPDAGGAAPGRLHFRASVLRAGGLLTTLGARRHVVYATQDGAFNYEAMLALDEGNPRRGVRRTVMDQLPTACAGKADLSCECHICMDCFSRGTHMTRLPCEHRFCSTCIRKWLHDHRTCPVCRYEFPDCQTIFVK